MNAKQYLVAGSFCLILPLLASSKWQNAEDIVSFSETREDSLQSYKIPQSGDVERYVNTAHRTNVMIDIPITVNNAELFDLRERRAVACAVGGFFHNGLLSEALNFKPGKSTKAVVPTLRWRVTFNAAGDLVQMGTITYNWSPPPKSHSKSSARI